MKALVATKSLGSIDFDNLKLIVDPEGDIGQCRLQVGKIIFSLVKLFLPCQSLYYKLQKSLWQIIQLTCQDFLKRFYQFSFPRAYDHGRKKPSHIYYFQLISRLAKGNDTKQFFFRPNLAHLLGRRL